MAERERVQCCIVGGGPAGIMALKCGCHPNCGIGTVLFVHKTTKQMIPPEP